MCAHTPSITVTSPLTPRGHNTHRHHRRAPTEYKSRWRPRVSPSTSRSSVSNLKSTSTESHRGHPTGLSGEGGAAASRRAFCPSIRELQPLGAALPRRPTYRAHPLITQPQVTTAVLCLLVVSVVYLQGHEGIYATHSWCLYLRGEGSVIFVSLLCL